MLNAEPIELFMVVAKNRKGTGATHLYGADANLLDDWLRDNDLMVIGPAMDLPDATKKLMHVKRHRKSARLEFAGYAVLGNPLILNNRPQAAN